MPKISHSVSVVKVTWRPRTGTSCYRTTGRRGGNLCERAGQRWASSTSTMGPTLPSWRRRFCIRCPSAAHGGRCCFRHGSHSSLCASCLLCTRKRPMRWGRTPCTSTSACHASAMARAAARSRRAAQASSGDLPAVGQMPDALGSHFWHSDFCLPCERHGTCRRSVPSSGAGEQW